MLVSRHHHLWIINLSVVAVAVVVVTVVVVVVLAFVQHHFNTNDKKVGINRQVVVATEQRTSEQLLCLNYYPATFWVCWASFYRFTHHAPD